MWNIKLIGALLIASLITLSLSGCARSNKTNVENKTNSEVKAMNQGSRAADFELKDLQGVNHKLSDYAGKKVYIKYWASWCSICLAGLDEMNTLAGADKDFEVINIVSPGFRGEKNSEDFKKWFSGLEYKNLTVLLDEGGTIANKYEVRGYPTSVVIGSDGTLVKKIVGHYNNEKIKSEFKDVK
ncbi:redoxin domain-containing protein [Clostridium lacusfryxellense]|uniref:redoxin domain-containing protein n=1 Tax=Clostridium lacusfryxellense TaxID=205328 RepID=UPI001C0AEC8B|nr:redoxin domain-containing protein [Clostridium lacusfryxellense]MBU3114263.1 redoxin domain-containing protein [Clostridium lacusfryxellense]